MDTKKSVIFRFRHALAFMTVLVFLFCYGMVCFAEDNQIRFTINDTWGSSNVGTITYESTLSKFYSGENYNSSNIPVLTWNGAINSFDLEGYDSSKISLNSRETLFLENQSDTLTYAKESFFASDSGYLYKFISSFDLPSSNLSVNFSENAFTINYSTYADYLGNTGFNYAYNSRVSGSGNICIIGSYIVSDAPFVFFETSYPHSYTNETGYYSIDTPENNGFYCLQLTGFTTSYDSGAGFCNCPMYLPTSDSSSGFSTFSMASTDFSFESDNYNFNTLLTGNIVVNPNAPLAPSTPSGHYLNNALRTVYERAGSDIDVWSYWTFNQYVKLHPEEFNIRYDWSISFKTSQDTLVQTYDYTGSLEAPITAFMLTGSNKNSYFRYPINFSGFKSGNTTLNSRLQSYFQSITGTTATFYDDWDLFGTGEHSITIDPKYSNFNNQIEVFIIYGTYVLTDDQGNSSGIFQDSYNFMNGNYDVVTNDIVNNYNPPDFEDLPSDIPLDLSSDTPSNYSNSPVFNDGDVYLSVNTNNNPFTLDDVSYANLKNMFNDIQDFINSTSENSFWTVLERTFSFIPAKIWEYIIISVAVICGFAVARYVVRR